MLVWARSNTTGSVVLVKFAPGTPRPVQRVERPSRECKAYLIHQNTFFSGFEDSQISTNLTTPTNPFNRNRNRIFNSRRNR